MIILSLFSSFTSQILLTLQTVGIYAIIDEESKFPQANDITLIEKMTKTFTKQSEFQRMKNQNLQFVVHHFAGPVCNSNDSTIIDQLLLATLKLCTHSPVKRWLCVNEVSVLLATLSHHRSQCLHCSVMKYRAGIRSKTRIRIFGV